MSIHYQFIRQTILDRFPGKSLPLHLHVPSFSEIDSSFLNHYLNTNKETFANHEVDAFEKRLAKITKAKHVITCVNATTALHLGLLLSNVKLNDEVFIPSLTFVASANAISQCGAIPHFLDVSPNTLGLDPVRISDYLRDIIYFKKGCSINKKTGRTIKALCVTHVLGHPADLDALKDICHQFHLTLVENASEALGSVYKDQHIGTKGLLGILSFNENNIISADDGGAILTNHSDIAEQAKHLSTTAKLPHPWETYHDQIAFNYRLPNLNAALGLAQLENFEKRIQLKRRLASDYQKAFNHIPHVEIFKEPDNARSNYWLNALMLDTKYANYRDQLLADLHKHQIFAQPLWQALHTLPMYRDCPSMDLEQTEELISRIICLPSSIDPFESKN